MLPPERTPRQRVIDLITGTRRSSYQLAQMLGIPERQVEAHLTHVVKTVARDKTTRFVLDPARCQDFVEAKPSRRPAMALIYLRRSLTLRLIRFAFSLGPRQCMLG